MRAVITVIGKDTVGIIAKVSDMLYRHNINILDISQTIMQDMFCMIMLVDTADMKLEFTDFSDQLKAYGEERNLKIHVMHEDIFNSMHRI